MGLSAVLTSASISIYMLMRDAERRKKEASKVKQTMRQNNIARPIRSLFQRKNELPQMYATRSI